jgi:hypothetical protein
MPVQNVLMAQVTAEKWELSVGIAAGSTPRAGVSTRPDSAGGQLSNDLTLARRG